MNLGTYIKSKIFSTLLVLFFILQFQNSSKAIDINWTISGNTEYTDSNWTNNASANNTRNSGQCKSSNYRSSTHCLPTHYDNYAIGSNTLTLNMSSNLTYTRYTVGIYADSTNNVISGTGTVIKSGNAMLTFDRVSNSFTGAFNVNDGTARITTNATLSTNTINVADGATLDLNDKNFNSSSRTITLDGTGHNSVGALYLSEGGSDNETFNNSTIQLNDDASIGVAASNDTLRLYDGDSDTVITRQGSENNDLTISGMGKVQVEDDINLGSGNITVGSNATLEMQGTSDNSIVGITAGTVTVNGTMILDSHDIFGNHSASSRPTMVINGTLTNATGHVNMLGATTLSGATINMSDGHSTGGRTLGIVFDDNVTVSGSSASTVSSSGTAVIGLTSNNASGSRDVTFDVGNVASGTDLTISAAIENGVGSTYPNAVASGLIKDGAGTMSLSSSSNTFTGSTVVRAGTLIVTSLSSSSTVTLTDSSTTSSDTPQLLIPLTTTLASDIVVANNSTASNPVIGSSGSGSNNAFFSGDITLNRNVTFHDAGTDRTTFTGVISSSNNDITITGTRVTLDNDSNSISGATFDVTDGSILQLNNEEVIGSSSTLNTVDLNSTGKLYINGGTGSSFYVGGLTGSGGTVQRNTGGTETINIGNNNDNSFGGVISGSDQNGSAATINVVKVGSGIQTLSGTNTYTGNTTVSAGTLEISGTLGSGDYAGDISNSGTLSFSSSSDQDLTGDISGTGALTKSGSGELKLLGSNNYTGNTTISGGTLRVAGTSSDTATLGQTNVTVNSEGRFIIGQYSSINGNATIDINSGGEMRVKQDLSNNITITGGGNTSSITNKGAIINTGGDNTYSGLITLDGNATIAASSDDMTFNVSSGNSFTGTGDLTFDTASNTITVSDPIANTGGVIKEDSGTLVLAGTNSFTGSTTVSGGTLNLTGSLPNTTALTVASGALFDTSNDETVGSIAGAGTIDIEHKTQLTVGGDNTSTTFSGVIRSDSGSGTGGITKQGTGTLTLSGTNTFSGAISVTAGTVAVTSNNALGDTTNRTNISSGATLDLQNVNYSTTEQVNTSGTISTSTGTSTLAGNVVLDGNSTIDVDGTQLTLSGVVSGGNAITKTGNGIAILSATNTYTGDTTISAGTLRVTGSLNSYTDVSVSSGATYDIDASDTISSLSGAGTIDIANSQTLTAGNSNNTTVSGVIQGAGGYTKIGTGTQTLSGANTYTGTTAINGGVLKVTGSLSNSTAVNVGSSGQYNVEASDTILSIEGSGTIDIASSQVLTAGDSNNKTFSGVIQSAGGYTKTGSGTQTFSGTNTYTGSTIINAGTLTVTGSLSDSTALRVASGATYDVDATDTVGSLSGAGTVDIASSQVLTAGNSSNQTLSGVIQGDGGYTKAGSGTQTLSGTNTYTGATTINAGTLTVTGLLSNSTSVTVASGATYDVDASDTIASIAGAGTIDIANSQTLTAGNSANTEISGSIAGSGGFTKAGTGILTLSGTNSYNGTTTINAGTLKVTGSLSNSTAVNVGSSGTYDVDASDTIASFEGSGTIDIAASQTLTAGDSNNKTFSGTMSGSGSLIKNGSGILSLSGNNSFSGGATLNTGVVQVGHNNALGSGTLTLAGATLRPDATARTLSQAVSINADTTLGRSGSPALTLSGDVTFSSGSVTVSSASNTIMSGAIDLGTGTKTFSVSSGKVQTASGVISNGSLTKSGDGRMNLTGDSTYTGTTLVSAGELRLQSGSSIDSTTVNVTGSGKLYLESTNALVSSANITLTGASAKLYVAENNTVNTVSGGGGIHIQSDNTLTVNDISSHTGKVKGQGDIVITGSHTIGAFIDTSDSTQDNINTRISGSGTTVTLGSSNVLPDDEDLTVENSATLELNSQTDTVRDVNLTAGTIQGGTITATRNHNVKSGTVASNSALAGSAALVKTTSDTVTLAGTNTYTGDTTVTTGALTVTGSIASSSNVTVNGGTLNLNNDDALKTTANVDVSSGSMNVNNDTTVGDFGASSGSTTTIASGKVLTINPTTADKEVYGLAGSGEFKKTGSTRTILKGSHSFTGDTRITGGTLQVASGASLNAATDVIVETGTSFDVDESITVASVTDSGDTDIASSKTLTVDHESSAGTMTYSGRLRGSGGFTKSGTGTYILRGQNDLSGDVTVSEGILYAGLAADSGTTIIANNVSISGGTLGGGATIGGNVTSTGGTLAPGNSIGTLTIDGDLVLDSSSTTTIEFNTTSADKVVISGDITVDGALVLEPESGTYSDIQFTIFDGSGGAGNSLSGTFASTTVNNNSNLGGATTSISYDTVNRKVFLDIGAAAASNTVKSLTTVSAFKDVAEIFDNATAGKILEVANVLKASDSASVNSELTKLEGSVLASSATQGIRNHGSYQKALNTATSFKSSSQVANFAKNNSSDLTLANLQSEGLFGEKRNWSEYFDYSDDTVLGFIKNNKNRSLLSDFKTDDKSSFIRTYGSETSRSNIGSTYIGYSSDTYGLLFGQQYQQNDNEFYGFSYGFTGTDTDYNNGNGESVNYTVHSSLFKQIDEEDYAMNIIGGGYVSKTESDRKVSVFGTSLDDVYKGETIDIGINGEIQYAKKFNFNGWSLAPSLAVSSIYEFRDDTDETGGELALKIDNENLFSLKPEVGISLDRDFSNKQNIKNQINLALFASQDHYLEGTTSKASYSTGSKFNVDIPRDKDTYLAAGLGYNFLNSESGTNLMANLFFTQNEENDIEGSIVSLTFRKLFGDFGRGRIPPVIAEKVEEGKDKVVKIILPEPTVTEKQSIVDEYADEIRRELALLFQKESTQFKAYKDIYANFDCRVLENDFYKVLHLLGRAELTFLLEKCKFNEENKVILIANRLNEIDQRDLTLLDHLRISYFKLSVYTPFLTFIAFVILMYELVKKGAINIYTRRKKF